MLSFLPFRLFSQLWLDFGIFNIKALFQNAVSYSSIYFNTSEEKINCPFLVDPTSYPIPLLITLIRDLSIYCSL
jgi:hypothetical protein